MLRLRLLLRVIMVCLLLLRRNRRVDRGDLTWLLAHRWTLRSCGHVRRCQAILSRALGLLGRLMLNFKHTVIRLHDLLLVLSIAAILRKGGELTVRQVSSLSWIIFVVEELRLDGGRARTRCVRFVLIGVVC